MSESTQQNRERSKSQQKIMDLFKSGSVMQCNEGMFYKVWMLNPDGTKIPIRRDYAEKFCNENKVIYGESKNKLYTQVTLR